MEPSLPEVIRVEIQGDDAAVTIDGEPFPWLIFDKPIDMSAHPSNMPTVTLTLLAERVELYHSFQLADDSKDRA